MDHHPPVIGVSACRKMGDFEYHSVFHKYITVILSLGALPVIIPSVGDMVDLTPLLARLDGLLFTGSATNVQPKLYHRQQQMAVPVEDTARDATTLPLMQEAVERGIPVFGICRGLQELNVALGGTLHQELHQVEGKHQHFLGQDAPRERMYEFAHEVEIMPHSLLSNWVKTSKIVVNSIHTQAIDELSDRLVAEAVAEDGTIEAVRARTAGFAYGVQWHPEHNWKANPVSQALFTAFGSAVSKYSAARHH